MLISRLLAKSIGGFVTIQDLGRRGFRNIGIPVSGALDRISHVYANALVGNDVSEASIEIIGMASFEVLEKTIVCVTGGGKIVVDGVEMDSWTPILVDRGRVVSIKPGKSPLSYLGVSGGIVCDEVLGSRSTYLRGGFGCLGRMLKPGDTLLSRKINVDEVWVRVKSLEPPFDPGSFLSLDNDVLELHATRSVHADLLDDLDILFKNIFFVSRESDRMGYRLEGPALKSVEKLGRLPSIPVDRGYVQIPPDGKPIVLMVDSQTMGGYAVALHVIHFDLDKLAHRQPGDKVSFREIDHWKAEEYMRDYLSSIEEPLLEWRGV